MARNIIQGGIYLVVDPSMPEAELLDKINQSVQENLSAIQIWDNFKADEPDVRLIEKIGDLCHTYHLPLLINNRWELLMECLLDGVHFDTKPDNLEYIANHVKRNFIKGLTCNNNLKDVLWADENAFDYISFCSIFPSKTSNSCELVSFDTIQKANQITGMPIFLAGGITPDNMNLLSELEYSGVAVISGVMNSDNPRHAVKSYKQKLKINNHEA